MPQGSRLWMFGCREVDGWPGCIACKSISGIFSVSNMHPSLACLSSLSPPPPPPAATSLLNLSLSSRLRNRLQCVLQAFSFLSLYAAIRGRDQVRREEGEQVRVEEGEQVRGEEGEQVRGEEGRQPGRQADERMGRHEHRQERIESSTPSVQSIVFLLSSSLSPFLPSCLPPTFVPLPTFVTRLRCSSTLPVRSTRQGSSTSQSPTTRRCCTLPRIAPCLTARARTQLPSPLLLRPLPLHAPPAAL